MKYCEIGKSSINFFPGLISLRRMQLHSPKINKTFPGHVKGYNENRFNGLAVGNIFEYNQTDTKISCCFSCRKYYLLKFSFELLVFPLIPFDLIAGFVERVNVELRELGPDLEVYYCRKDLFFNKYMNICTYIMNILGKY